MKKIIEYFLSRVRLSAKNENKNRILNFMNENQINYFDLKDNGECITFEIFSSTYGKYNEFSEYCAFISEKGFVRFLKSIIKRPGLIVGVMIFASTLYASNLFVWDVRLYTTGNEDRDNIIKVLYEYGAKSGALKSSIDKKRIENIIMLKCPDVSYVSVNDSGNVISVTTDERIIRITGSDTDGPCDLAANEDGVIVRYETYSGQTLCKKNQSVKKGEVLISGYTETKHHGYTETKANGKVYAMVKRNYMVSVSIEKTEKVYTEKESKTVSVSMFSKEFILKNEKHSEDCDVFTTEDNIRLFDKITLPLKLKTSVYRKYENVKSKRSEEECIFELNELSKIQFTEVTKGAEVIASNEKISCEDGTYTLYCEVWCIADIAKKAPISYKKAENTE